jgi:hypothetical protein
MPWRKCRLPLHRIEGFAISKRGEHRFRTVSVTKPAQSHARLSSVVSAVLLTLTTCLIALWTHSLWWRLELRRQAALPAFAYEDEFYTCSHNGRWFVCYSFRDEPHRSRLSPAPEAHWDFRHYRDLSGTTRYGGPELLALVGLDGTFRFEQVPIRDGHVTIREMYFTVPIWLPIILTGTAGWIVGRRARIVRHRLRRGLCIACGYDARATPQRCPECGCAPAYDGPRPAAAARASA